MFVYKNGVRIEVFDDSSIKLGGKTYHDDDKQRLKYIEKKLVLFKDERGEVDFDKLPKRLQERLSATLGVVFNKLDENKDDGFVAINHLRAFGFLKEDRERMKRASEQMNLIAYQMGLGSFEAAFERFKESEKKKVSLDKDAAKFINEFSKSKEAENNYSFFKSELKRLGVEESVIVKEYAALQFSKNKIATFMAIDKEKRLEAFIEDYKENGYSSFSYFNAALSSFGVDSSDILKKYIDIGGDTSKKIEDFYNEVYKNNVLPDREKIARFVIGYKNSGQSDFGFFYETLQDYGVTDTKEILLYFNDSIDQSFRLDSREFALISAAKAELVGLQEKIINDAIAAGFEVPSNLSRFVSPSDKIKDEKINPQKKRMIAFFDFSKEPTKYKSSSFDAMGNISSQAKTKLDKNISSQLDILHKDTDRSVGFINLTLIKNNGFSFERMKEFALYNAQSNIIGPQRAMSVAITGLKQCNKLVECGILQSSDNKNFTFTSPRSREILFENPEATYNELADMVIKEHNITFTSIKDIEEKPLDKELFDSQRVEFEEFLDAQFKSYYIPQGLGIYDFKTDVMSENSEEFARFRDLYSELKKGIDFEEAVADFVDKGKYIYVREPSLNLNSKAGKSSVDALWTTTQKVNHAIGDFKSPEKILAQSNFINLSAVRFGGIDFGRLLAWGENAIKKGGLSKEAVEAFISASLKRGEDLSAAGVMVKNEKNYVFADEFAREAVFHGYNSSVSEIAALNRGVKTALPAVSDEKTAASAIDMLSAPDSGFGVSYSVGKPIVGGSNKDDLLLNEEDNILVDKINHFNFAWKLSGDQKYRNMMTKIEREFKNEIKINYFKGAGFNKYLDNLVHNIHEDLSGLKSCFFDELYEEIEVVENEDSKAVFNEILNHSDLQERVSNG